ncbi:hypothetical protein CPB86DRAFT_399671 [Serendipita vermifera]|nr:hypothetical protein CPB86DRAFT_399671 [Serendipita vermifera]
MEADTTASKLRFWKWRRRFCSGLGTASTRVLQGPNSEEVDSRSLYSFQRVNVFAIKVSSRWNGTICMYTGDGCSRRIRCKAAPLPLTDAAYTGQGRWCEDYN